MAININKDITYKTAQPKEKEYLISDGGSLYLLVKPEGAKFWRFIYSFGGKRPKITLGLILICRWPMLGVRRQSSVNTLLMALTHQLSITIKNNPIKPTNRTPTE